MGTIYQVLSKLVMMHQNLAVPQAPGDNSSYGPYTRRTTTPSEVSAKSQPSPVLPPGDVHGVLQETKTILQTFERKAEEKAALTGSKDGGKQAEPALPPPPP
eukprot:5347858-Amphidinium_carterae.1